MQHKMEGAMKRIIGVCFAVALVCQASAVRAQQSEKKDLELLENISSPMRDWNDIGKGTYNKMILTCQEIITPFTTKVKTVENLDLRHKAATEAINLPLEQWWATLEKQDEILNHAQEILLKYDADLASVQQCDKPYSKSPFPGSVINAERGNGNALGIVDPKNATRMVDPEIAWQRILAINKILQAKDEVLKATDDLAQVVQDFNHLLAANNNRLRVNKVWIDINQMRKAIREMKEQVKIMIKVMEEPSKP